MNRITFPLFAFLLFSKTLLAQVDTMPPVIVCNNNSTLVALSYINVTSTDFLDTFYDNTSGFLELGVRKVCTGSGFPENKSSVIFVINEYGNQTVEVWARDTTGNTTSCLSTVFIDIGSSDPGSSLYFFTPDNEGIDSVTTFVKGSHCYYDSIDYQIPNDQGLWTSWAPGYWMTYRPMVLHAGYNFTAYPIKNINPLNGVSTNDLVLISKHILGIQPLDSPWKLIAADANQDGKITTTDIVVLRKLILGITSELPNGKSWRFVPQPHSFPDPANPFQPPFPERGEVPNTADPAPAGFNFKGVKIGDVDFSADPDQ